MESLSKDRKCSETYKVLNVTGEEISVADRVGNLKKINIRDMSNSDKMAFLSKENGLAASIFGIAEAVRTGKYGFARLCAAETEFIIANPLIELICEMEAESNGRSQY